jgi:hypothetical protein
MSIDKINPFAIPYKAKNEIVPKIYKNFLTDEDVKEINKLIEIAKTDESIDGFYKPYVLSQLSRMQIELIYPKNIKEKLENFASELCGEDVVMTHNSYLDYSMEHGDGVIPSLPPHFDSDNYYTKITFDYQLFSNIDWPVVVDNKYFNLNNGDLLTFWGSGIMHWRENINLKPEEKTTVLTWHFANLKDHEELSIISRLDDEREKRSSILQEKIDYYYKFYLGRK